MGNLCDCFKDQGNNYPTAKTPLLSGNNSHNVTEPPPEPVTSQAARHSARLYKPEERDFESSMDALAPVHLEHISTLPSMDKTFQDHGKLYNDMYGNFIQLRKCLHDFKAKFVSETAGIPTMAECLRLLAQRCGGITLQGSRTKNCIQIEYDPKKISQVCQGPAEDILETLELYNKANKLIRNILDKSKLVQNTFNLVLEEEDKLKREVTKADPDGKFGPAPLRTTTENLNKMHKVPERIDTIHKYTSRAFKEISEGSRVLFQGAGAPT